MSDFGWLCESRRKKAQHFRDISKIVTQIIVKLEQRKGWKHVGKEDYSDKGKDYSQLVGLWCHDTGNTDENNKYYYYFLSSTGGNSWTANSKLKSLVEDENFENFYLVLISKSERVYSVCCIGKDKDGVKSIVKKGTNDANGVPHYQIGKKNMNEMECKSIDGNDGIDGIIQWLENRELERKEQ